MDRILVLLNNGNDVRVVGDFLKNSYDVVYGRDVESISQDFDLAIVDGPMLLKVGDGLEEKKHAQGALFVPAILVTTNRDANLLSRQIWQKVDEIITAPIKRQELIARIEVLLRTRRQSIEIDRLKQSQIEQMGGRLELATKAANIGLFDLDIKTNQVYHSKEWKSILGYSDHESTDHYDDLKMRTHPDDRERVITIFRELESGSRDNYSLEYRMRHSDGDYRWILSMGSVIMDSSGKPARILGARMDITDRKESQEALERLATAIEYAAESVVITDSDGRITYVNPAFEQVTGYSRKEVMGQNPRILKSGEHEPAFYRNIWETLSSQKIWNGLFKNRRKDGSVFYEQSTISPVRDTSGKVVAYVSVKRDVTAEKCLQEQLAQSQKMEAIGTLAGGIAHDFNNILYTITGSAELALAKAQNNRTISDNLNRILKAADRASDMVKQILTFSRQSTPEKQTFDVSPIVKEAVKLLRGAIPSSVEIVTEIQPAVPNIEGDPTQVYQILMNLCSNAAHSMKKSGGKLTVKLTCEDLTTEFTALHPPIYPGRFLRLSVSDTGEGIPVGVLSRIFEPYFTTKEVGEGTGLGLSVLHGIVQSYGGAVTVRSEPGQGSTFDVYLPTTLRQTEETQEDATETTSRFRGKLLWVDDEKLLIDMVSQTLGYMGFEVVAALCPLKALDIFRLSPESFDIVVTDLTMPGMSGIEFARSVTSIRSETPVILCTGYGRETYEPEIYSSGIKAVLHKPVKRGELVIAIQKALDSSTARQLADSSHPAS